MDEETEIFRQKLSEAMIEKFKLKKMIAPAQYETLSKGREEWAEECFFTIDHLKAFIAKFCKSEVFDKVPPYKVQASLGEDNSLLIQIMPPARDVQIKFTA